MSKNSYVDTIYPQLAERKDKVDTATRLARSIIRQHGTFDRGTDGSPMETPQVVWKEDGSKLARLRLLGPDGKAIPEAKALGHPSIERAVGSAVFTLYDGQSAYGAAIIDMQPRNVRGFDTQPLASWLIADVIDDLERYQDLLATGQIAD